MPLQNPRRGLDTSKTPFAHHWQRGRPQQVEKESPSHMDTLLSGPLWEERVIQHQVEVTDGLNGVLPP